MTTSTLNRLAPTQVELDIPITTDELAAAEERAFRELVKHARVPGFRKGKVPRKVFEQAYGSDAITSQALDELLPAAYARAVREHDLDPVARPKMEVVERSQGRPTRLRATVEVRPEIGLGDYKGIPVRASRNQVTDEDVERSLAALAKERALAVPVERPARLGDVVTLTYQGTIDGSPFEGGSAANAVLELTQDGFIPGFVAGIVGMRAGEAKEIEATFPPEYAQASLAGKTARFSVTVHEIKELELPALDDDFAKAVSGSQTLEELRADLKRRLAAVARARERRAIGNAVLEHLLATQEIPLPPSMVESETEHLMDDAAMDAARAGLSLQEYLEQLGKSEEQLRAECSEEARSRVKATLLIEHIAKQEKIAATPADVQEELEALARRYGQPVARIRKALGSNILSLMEGIVRDKTLDFLVDHAQLTAGEETSMPAS
jgi:trigger factor